MTTVVRRRIVNSHENESSNNELRVIGVGLPRTGTASLRTALEILGFGPCHHMFDIFEKPSRAIEFARAYDGENVDFHALMQGYGSTVDAPTVDFYREIHQAYPQAKLILTVRDNDQKWFDSFQNTIGWVAKNNFYYYAVYPIRFLRLQCIMGRKGFQRWKQNYGGIQPSMHSKHNKKVLEENPEGSVLVYNVKEGWEPLCQFLNVPVPKDIQFPNENDAKEFRRRIMFAKVLGLSTWTIICVSFCLSSYFLIKNFNLL